MQALLFWFLASFGFCYVVGHARISLNARERVATIALAYRWKRLERLLEMIECPACLGFWVGIVGGLAWPWLVPVEFPRWASAPLLGVANSAIGYILGRATGWITERVE